MMNEKRFTINLEDECIDDAEERIFIDFNDRIDFYELCAFLNEQQATISRLEEENDNMNLFIKQTIEPLLWDCVFELNTIESMSQVELAEKIENEIIPFIQEFKYLKYESLEEEKQDKSE